MIEQNKIFTTECHAFNVDLASIYGIEEAIFINHFAFWVKHNSKNKKNIIDGKVWMYQTHEQILVHFPYFKNRSKIIRTIQSLIKQKVIEKKSFNLCKFDRTSWFTFLQPELFISDYKNIIPKKSAEETAPDECETEVDVKKVEFENELSDKSEMNNQKSRNQTIRKVGNELSYKVEDDEEDDVEDDKTYTYSKTQRRVASSSSVSVDLILGDLYKKVRLSQMQLDTLIKEIGEDKAKLWIEKLDGYMASSGKKYKDHLATLRNWIRSNADKEALQGENSHIAAHRINSKMCIEKGKPPSGYVPPSVNVFDDLESQGDL